MIDHKHTPLLDLHPRNELSLLKLIVYSAIIYVYMAVIYLYFITSYALDRKHFSNPDVQIILLLIFTCAIAIYFTNP